MLRQNIRNFADGNDGKCNAQFDGSDRLFLCNGERSCTPLYDM